MPLVEPIVASKGLLSDQVPPLVALLRWLVPPGQTEVLPEIAEGAAFTVTGTLAVDVPQPFVFE